MDKMAIGILSARHPTFTVSNYKESQAALTSDVVSATYISSSEVYTRRTGPWSSPCDSVCGGDQTSFRARPEPWFLPSEEKGVAEPQRFESTGVRVDSSVSEGVDCGASIIAAACDGGSGVESTASR
jgi:hypothetical protein